MPHPGSRATHTLELVVGVVLLIASVVLWRRRAERPRAGHERLKHASPLVGATIALAELPTAVPYFVVIVAVARSHVGAASTVALLAVYQVLYLAPVLVIAILSQRASHAQSGMRGDRVHSVLLQYENRLIATILFVVGVVLLALATSATGL